MKVVGIRELKNRLSEYIRLVKSGQNVLVTERGEVVAELRPPGPASLDSKRPALAEMLAQGKIRLGASNDPGCYPRMEKAASHEELMRMLDQERGTQ